MGAKRYQNIIDHAMQLGPEADDTKNWDNNERGSSDL